jgi:hypothetical protein
MKQIKMIGSLPINKETGLGHLAAAVVFYDQNLRYKGDQSNPTIQRADRVYGEIRHMLQVADQAIRERSYNNGRGAFVSAATTEPTVNDMDTSGALTAAEAAADPQLAAGHFISIVKYLLWDSFCSYTAAAAKETTDQNLANFFMWSAFLVLERRREIDRREADQMGAWAAIRHAKSVIEKSTDCAGALSAEGVAVILAELDKIADRR